MIPSSRSMLSRNKRLPPDTWNTSGLQENVIGNPLSTFDSPQDHPQGIHPCPTQRERESVPQAAGRARDDEQNERSVGKVDLERRVHQLRNGPCHSGQALLSLC